MPRRRRNTGPPRCKTCGAIIVWLQLRGSWRSFEPRPVPAGGRAHDINPSYPVEGKIAWPVDDLVAEFQVRRQCSEPEARDEVYDLDWRTVHHCPDDFERKGTPAQLQEARNP